MTDTAWTILAVALAVTNTVLAFVLASCHPVRVWRNLRRGLVARWEIVTADRQTYRGEFMVHDYDPERIGFRSHTVNAFVIDHVREFVRDGEIEIRYVRPTLEQILKL